MRWIEIGIAVVFAVAVSAAAGAQENVAGEWRVVFKNEAGYQINEGTMTIAQEGTKLAGGMETTAGPVELEGTIAGTRLEYEVVADGGDAVMWWKVEGVVDDDEIRGTFDGSETGPGSWVATRIERPPAPTVTATSPRGCPSRR